MSLPCVSLRVKPNQAEGGNKKATSTPGLVAGVFGGWNLELAGRRAVYWVRYVDIGGSVGSTAPLPPGQAAVTGRWARGACGPTRRGYGRARDPPVPGPSRHVPAPAWPRQGSCFLGAKAILPRTGAELHTRERREGSDDVAGRCWRGSLGPDFATPALCWT